jgi:pyrroloquinoline quinone (PQQ) biosynthesis protein C
MISQIENKVKAYRDTLLEHPLYSEIKTPEHLQSFMEFHVFAVWDFMSLLKALQQGLTCTTIPWKPIGNPETRYLINEIVLAEETDINKEGKRQSHFEMYIDAMKKAEASTLKIDSLLSTIETEKDIIMAIENSNLPKAIVSFLSFTFNTIKRGKMHEIAAAFTFGREDLIPEMFSVIIKNIQKNFPEKDLSSFKYYFDRHIELDGDEHGPMALQMVEQLCENDGKKWREVEHIVVASLQAREQLWDGILDELLQPQLT